MKKYFTMTFFLVLSASVTLFITITFSFFEDFKHQSALYGEAEKFFNQYCTKISDQIYKINEMGQSVKDNQLVLEDVDTKDYKITWVNSDDILLIITINEWYSVYILPKGSCRLVRTL
jgi:hypothetical protein